ncbi:MAG: hypothetical protein H7Z17_17115 [Fuerstia sp.]|nr:hypothetical protein [Fuerstiella sp.]
MYDSHGIVNHRARILPAISDPGHEAAHRGRLSASLISITGFLRGLPLFVSARPRSPLRVLCIMAFDTLHRCRTSKRLPTGRLRLLAVCLDFEAAANAALDGKESCGDEFRTTRRVLEDAGMFASVTEYMSRLRELETNRPSPGGDDGQFEKVMSYREAVVRLSLSMVATTAFGLQSIEDEFRATQSSDELHLLFRIAMQCQIIDDVLDYSNDASAGLPSFLTASTSLPQSLELTHEAALSYADIQHLRHSAETFPLRLALSAVSNCARLVIVLSRWRQKTSVLWRLSKQCASTLRGFFLCLIAAACR